MNRAEALRLATEIVREQIEPAKKSNGYVHDKWTPTPLHEQTQAILEIANFLVGENDETVGIHDPIDPAS